MSFSSESMPSLRYNFQAFSCLLDVKNGLPLTTSKPPDPSPLPLDRVFLKVTVVFTCSPIRFLMASSLASSGDSDLTETYEGYLIFARRRRLGKERAWHPWRCCNPFGHLQVQRKVVLDAPLINWKMRHLGRVLQSPYCFYILKITLECGGQQDITKLVMAMDNTNTLQSQPLCTHTVYFCNYSWILLIGCIFSLCKNCRFGSE